MMAKAARRDQKAPWMSHALGPAQYPPGLCISYANVHNYYGPYAYCCLDKGVACAQHIQLPTHMCEGHMC